MRDAMLTASWQAGGLAVIVWLLTTFAGRWISPRWRCMLWSLVFIRLVLPALPPSPLSLLNVHPPALTETPKLMNATPHEVVTFGVGPDAAPPRTASAVVSAAPRIDWSACLLIIWLIVAAMLILRMTFAYWRLVMRLRRLTPTNDPRVVELLGGSTVRAFETNLVTSPAIVGVFRPRLLLPPDLVDRLTRDELRFIILHELVHVRRRDILISAIVAVITAIHWFNPLVWLAAARFRAERELACDEAVLAATSPEARPAYGATILRLLEQFPQPSRHDRLIGAVGVLSSSRRTIRRRITLIAAPRRRFALLGPILVIVLALATLTGPRIRAAATPPSPPSASAATTTSPTDDPLDTLTRVYDIRDILTEIPSFDYEPDSDGFPISRPAATTKSSTVPDAQRDEQLRKLMADITGSIDPMSWRDNTGTVGSIRELQGQLIITQTTANHARILEKLQAMRGPREMQVMLESRFIGNLDAEALLKDRWPPNPARSGYDLWPRFLTDVDVNILRDGAQKDVNATTIAAPRVILHNGQRAYVMVTRQTAHVADLKKRPGGGDDDEYDPVVKLVNSGILLDARAQVVSDDDGGAKYVTLMLNPRMSTLLELVPQPWPGAPAGRKNLTIQVPHTLVSHLKTTITVPDGQTALFRLYPERKPATLPAAVAPTRPADTNLAAPTLLLVKPTVIEAKTEQQEFPLISTRADDSTSRRASTARSPAPAPLPSSTPRPLDSRR